MWYMCSEITNEESDTNSSKSSQHQPSNSKTNSYKKLVFKNFSI